jgi:8-oxo-dGTP pyrophosphatase MutT (NUDIX family)
MNYAFRRRHPDQSPNPWHTHHLELRYDNPWVAVTHRQVTNPSGRAGIYGVVHFKNIAVGVVPLDDTLHTWLVGQYRYTLGQYHWEIPEGGCPAEESTLEAAQRELLEETGITAHTWQPLLETHLSNSVTDEYGVCYVARDLEFGEAQPEDTEQLHLRRLPLAEAVEMVMRGDITDSLSVMALLKVNECLRRGTL